MDREHGGVPGHREQQEEKRSRDGEAALPELAPPSCHREVGNHSEQGHGDTNGPLGEGANGHTRIKQPQEVALPPFAVKPQPKTEQ